MKLHLSGWDSDDSAPADGNIDNIEDPLDLTQLSAPPTLTITNPPLNPATRLASRPVVVKVSIPLKILFKYPTDATPDPPSEGMNRFWRGGIQNLDKEMEVYELLGSGEDNTDVNSETPRPIFM